MAIYGETMNVECSKDEQNHKRYTALHPSRDSKITTRRVTLTSFLIAFALATTVLAQQPCSQGTIAIWVQQGEKVQIGCSKDSLNNLDQTVQGLSQQVQNLAQQLQALQAKRNPPPSHNNTGVSGGGTNGHIAIWTGRTDGATQLTDSDLYEDAGGDFGMNSVPQDGTALSIEGDDDGVIAVGCTGIAHKRGDPLQHPKLIPVDDELHVGVRENVRMDAAFKE